jgi:WhiB family redox-sensing transcriptional regulator
MGGLRREQRLRLLGELGFTVPASGGWRERAGCAGVDPELFFPVGSRRPVRALQICGDCPVRELCLADAMATEDPAMRWGVLGGLTPTRRSHLFKQQRNDRKEVA